LAESAGDGFKGGLVLHGDDKFAAFATAVPVRMALEPKIKGALERRLG
jgi:hypothetical protein